MGSPTKIRLAVAGAALAGCAVGGVAFGPAFAGALQDDTTTTAPEDTTTTAPAEEGDGTTPPEGCEPGEGGPGGFGRGGPGGHFGPGPGFDAAAEAIGIEVDALRTALQDGQTIAEVAEANGMAVEDVVATMVAAAQERLAEAVADGRIDQERADEIGADLEERITDAVHGELPMHGPRGDRPDQAEED